MSGVKVYFLVGFRFCRCLAFYIIVFKRRDWCWMFLLADMQNVPNIAIIFLLKFGRSVQSIGERIKSLLCSWFFGICFPFHRILCVFFSIWSCTEHNPRENVFQSILTKKKQRNCRYLHAFLGQFFRANLGTYCMSGCWCWCYCCQQCLYILTRFKHSMPGYVGTIPRWSQFILVWISTDMDQGKTPVGIFHSSVKSQYYLQYWKSYLHGVPIFNLD